MAELHDSCSQYPDLQHVLIDNTITRTHAWRRRSGVGKCRRSSLGALQRGGFTTDIHAITEALGNSLDFILTGGQTSDIGQVITPMIGMPTCVTRHSKAGGWQEEYPENTTQKLESTNLDQAFDKLNHYQNAF